jgi:hypothetical protein
MRRNLAVVACAGALLAASQGVASAAPLNGHNTEDLVVECAGDTVRIITNPGASGWEVDAERELTGVRYFITSADARFYEGELTTEPTGVDPVFAFAKEWGNRTGHEGTVSCTDSETFTEDGQTFTGFFDFTATRQEKGN